MKPYLHIIIRYIPALVMVALGGLIIIITGLSAGSSLQLRVPIPENQQLVRIDQSNEGIHNGQLTRFDIKPSQIPGSWPQFRGPNRDGIYNDPNVTISGRWQDAGPRVLWSIGLGEGYAGAAIHRGCVYVLDYDQQQHADALRCLALADGKEIWRYSYPVKIKRNHGMSRTVPAVTDQAVIGLGPKCHLTCLDPRDGTLKWGMDLVKELGATVPPWYAGQCPLIHEGKVIIGVGGTDLAIAIDVNDGRILWRTPNPENWTMTHSSIAYMELEGIGMYIWCTSGAVVGIDAQDGKILWSYPEWKISIANVPMPVVVGDGKVFLSGGYNAGAMMLRLIKSSGGIEVEPVYRLAPTIFGSPQHTPILFQGYLYGVRPDGQMVCLDLDGKIVWTSGPKYRFGLGPYAVANGLLFAMDDEGLLTVAPAVPTGFSPISQAKILGGHESWGPMAFVAGRMIVRDLTNMVCLDIAER